MYATPCETVAAFMFIRRKTSRNRETFQLVESYRKDGKVRQRVIIDLGRKDTVEGAIAVCERRITWMTREIEECREFVRKFSSEPFVPRETCTEVRR
jgi:hypothetical protein